MSLLLMLVLIGTTSGISVYKHYCGDLLEEISIFIQSNPCSDEGGEAACSAGKEMNCCDNETEYYQLEVDLVKTSQHQINFRITPQIILFGLAQNHLFFIEESKSLNYLELPPIISDIPLYKQLKQFTFYG